MQEQLTKHAEKTVKRNSLHERSGHLTTGRFQQAYVWVPSHGEKRFAALKLLRASTNATSHGRYASTRGCGSASRGVHPDRMFFGARRLLSILVKKPGNGLGWHAWGAQVCHPSPLWGFLAEKGQKNPKRTGMTRLGSPGVSARSISVFFFSV